MASVELTGTKELLATLEKLGADVRKHKKDALMAGAKVIQKEISDRAVFVRGYSKGAIAKNIIIVQVNPNYGEPYALVGPDMSKVHYANFVEFGTSKSRAQPFVEPAFIAKREEALEAIADVIRAEIEQRGGQAAADAMPEKAKGVLHVYA